MLTMQKEKVNTHFSFPLKLDMSDYVEKSLLPQQYQESAETKQATGHDGSEIGSNSANQPEEYNDRLEYNLIGVTVHTGNADGGHYYSFIKERSALHGNQQDRWFLFNDAEVKQFDPSQIEAECFGGEMTSKTYDTVTEKYLDFSFEKTNSAYMLFYERCSSAELNHQQQILDEKSATSTSSIIAHGTETSSQQQRKSDEPIEIESAEDTAAMQNKCDIDYKHEISKSKNDCPQKIAASESMKVHQANMNCVAPNAVRSVMNKELEEWIWEDNRYFLQDRNIFEHTYFK